jgi:hypothetical protein
MDNCKHSWGSWVLIKADSDGTELWEKTCGICGKVETEIRYN